MAEFHFNHTATLLPDGRVLVAGGGPGAVSGAELYDPRTGRWTATGSMATARGGHTATRLPDGKVLVAGGDKDGFLASAELYDPRTGRWTATGSMAEARIAFTATLLPDGRVLVAGGYSVDGADLASAELYDPRSGRWTATGTMATARYGHTATRLPDGTVLVAGGYLGVGSDGTSLASAERYDPVSGRWIATGSMAEARFRFTATLLRDGRVLVAGGREPHDGPGRWLASAELYDPRSGRFTATGSMAEARYDHTATPLPDGTMLVAGGYKGDGSAGDAISLSAELYEPSSGQWTATASMVVPRVGPTATLLPDGRVLVAGGDFTRVEDYAENVKSAELYDP